MTATTAVPAPRTLLDRFGFPEVRGSGKFLAASLIQSTGNGLLLAFQLVYFTSTTAMSVVEVGAALTTARLLALPAPALVGPMIDRFGARRVVVAANLVSALAFCGFLLVAHAWQVVLTGLAVQLGTAMFWTANSALTSQAARPGDRTRWFGLIRVVRNLGLGGGGAVAAIVTGASQSLGLRALVVGCALAYGVAALLMARWQPREPERPAAAGAVAQPDRASYLMVLRDGRYLRLVALNTVFVLAAMVLNFLLALYVVRSLNGPTWLVGVLLTLNSILVVGGQSLATRVAERFPLRRSVAVAAALDALAFGAYAFVDGRPGWLVTGGLIAATVILTAGEVLASPALGELSVALAPDHAVGRYLATFQLSWTLGMAVAPWLFTELLNAGPVVPWLVMAALSLLTIPATRGLNPPAAAEPADAAPQ